MLLLVISCEYVIFTSVINCFLMIYFAICSLVVHYNENCIIFQTFNVYQLIHHLTHLLVQLMTCDRTTLGPSKVKNNRSKHKTKIFSGLYCIIHSSNENYVQFILLILRISASSRYETYVANIIHFGRFSLAKTNNHSIE